ncbi:MAG: Gfo/Idh/MocA family oxidoreductase [Oscillospiraceae bacterium]|nr:Gfo/Idh/MocA family oxidoreductase [Oscillospiraceae bacterium]MBQ3146710.1 Gfo/Idh/MocA family oxidoreductase [Oscillospiraceae bacterium]
MKRMRVGVVGSGKISPFYLKNITERFHQLEVVCCASRNIAHARARAEEFGIRAVTVAQLLADPTIEMVIVLTPVPAHYELIKEALLAGKHVYSEKTVCENVAQARELVALAKEKDLYFGAAPDTFLGAAWQKARQLIDQDAVGEVTSFRISMNRNVDYAASRFPFLRLRGGGTCYDMGGYYLTNLVNLLGPIQEVCAVVENRKTVRTACYEGEPDYGQTFEYHNESQVSAIVRTCSGVTGTFHFNGESLSHNLHQYCIYGRKGILQLPDPNAFGGEVSILREEGILETTENELPYHQESRGVGPAEMADAIREGRKNRASAALALHVLDVIESMMESSRRGGFVEVRSRCEQEYRHKSVPVDDQERCEGFKEQSAIFIHTC